MADLRAGAFEFYFSRPVRPIDYVFGKAGGVILLMATALFAGPVLLSLFRLGFAADFEELIDLLPVVPKAMLVGAIATVAYAVVPLAFSAISSKTRHTVAAWAAFYLLGGSVAWAVSQGTGISAIGALDISQSILGLSYAIFDVTLLRGNVPSLAASLVSLCGYSAVALGFLYWRVVRAESAGM